MVEELPSDSEKPNVDKDKTKSKSEILMAKLENALETSDKDTLYKLGDLLYETFSSDQYSPEVVLSSIREVYEENKNKLLTYDSKMSFNRFVQFFGPGLVKLCQRKLLQQGGYDLGKFGEKKDGIDGLLGWRTSGALNRYFIKQKNVVGTVESLKQSRPVLAQTADSRQQTADSRQQTADSRQQTADSRQQTAMLDSYLPGDQEPVVTAKRDLAPQVEDIYDENPTTFTTGNLHNYFGNRLDHVRRFITDKDPITGEPITFLGRPINGGLNLMVIPFLKIAEAAISKSDVNYQPRAKNIGGFHFRGMKVGGVETNTPSFHKVGLAFDIDASNNGASYNNPAMNRGDIPDQVVLAMVNAGFAWGGVGGRDFFYLGDDPMHFQLRFHPNDSAGQSIINSSEIGKQYWNAIIPMLPA